MLALDVLKQEKKSHPVPPCLNDRISHCGVKHSESTMQSKCSVLHCVELLTNKRKRTGDYIMGKKDNLIFAPLDLLKRTSARFPLAWEQMATFHRDNGKDDFVSWPDWCYAPIAAAIAVATNGAIVSQPEQLLLCMTSAQTIAALAPWRLSKEVFIIDSNLESLLYEQQDDLDLQPEILLQLPYPCFYVQVSSLIYYSKKVEGFFVHLEYDVNSGERELRILYLFDDRSVAGCPVHIDEDTLRESMQHFVQQAHNNLTPGSPLRRMLLMDSDSFESLESTIKKTLQLILYLCAKNAEVQQNPEQSTVMKRSGTIQDKYSEIRKWDVGVRIGQAVSRYKESSGSRTTTYASHASPRPHMRRGHWHNYWTGPKSGERKLILKWTAPTFVGLVEDDSPVVVHRVALDDQEQ